MDTRTLAGRFVPALLLALLPFALASRAGAAELELRPQLAEAEGVKTVEYRSGNECVARSTDAAPAGVELMVPGQGTAPVRFATSTVTDGVVTLGPTRVGVLTLQLRIARKTPALLERVLVVRAEAAAKFAVAFPLDVLLDGEYESFTGPESARALSDTVRGSSKTATFPVAMVRASDRVLGIVADSPGLWENRCLVLLDPSARRLAVLAGDGREPYPLVVKPPEDARDTYQYLMDGWQTLAAGETRSFATWVFVSPARSHYDAQVAAHIAVANAKGWSGSLLEAILRNTSLFLLRRNLALDADGRPHGHILYSWNSGYVWLRKQIRARLGHTGPDPVDAAVDRRYGVVRDAGVLRLAPVATADNAKAVPLIGYTELRTDLPGGRHANVRTMRAVVVGIDGRGRRELAQDLTRESDAWTQFAGWSPDGTRAIVARGWNDPANARWEEEHRTFRMEPGKWLLDAYLVELATGAAVDLTSVERVSHYNGGLFFMPDGHKLGFTALVGGVSKPFVMDLDGTHKRDLSSKDSGFAYGYSASPDGALISYHEDYQVCIARADGTQKRRIETGNPFNFGPRWSPDGAWVLFVSGERGRSDPYVVRRDGTGLRKLADLGGYQGWILFLDVDDFHEGSSDVPVWAAEGTTVFFTAQVGKSVELLRTTLEGPPEALTKSPEGTLHYHPQPSPDGAWLAYGSKRDGVRQLYVMRLADRLERRLTDLPRGRAAMWPHWQPALP